MEIIYKDKKSVCVDVRRFIDTIIKNKPHLKISSELSLLGVSGNKWRVDLAIEDTRIKDKEKSVKVIIECKDMGRSGKRPAYSTYRNHMHRAYAELGDLRNQTTSSKFLIVPYKEKKKGRFDFNAYFKSIDVEFTDFSNSNDREKLQARIENLD